LELVEQMNLWNTFWNIFWLVICMALLIGVIIVCVIVDLTVTVFDFLKKLFTKDQQHN